MIRRIIEGIAIKKKTIIFQLEKSKETKEIREIPKENKICIETMEVDLYEPTINSFRKV